jgi:hypothetical protein
MSNRIFREWGVGSGGKAKGKRGKAKGEGGKAKGEREKGMLISMGE